MAWRPRPEDKTEWSAAGGVVTVVMGALAATSPLWPLWGALAVVGFYFTFATLLHWWPHTHGRLPAEPLTSFELWL
jgi:uncharacterized membrane protein HdeD (DUF308 family)